MRPSVAGAESSVPHGQSAQLWGALKHLLAELDASGCGVVNGRVQVLDCGGGSGRLAVPLAVLGADVTVVDVSIDALSTLSRRAIEAGVSARVLAVQGDVELLGDLVAPAGFGLVLAHDVLASVADPVASLAQLTGALAPGGLLSIVAPNPVSAVLARVLAGDIATALALVRQHNVSADRSADLVEGCRDLGLVVESVSGLGVFTDLLSGADLEASGAGAELAELEAETATSSPYREIASKLHIVARRPAANRHPANRTADDRPPDTA